MSTISKRVSWAPFGVFLIGVLIILIANPLSLALSRTSVPVKSLTGNLNAMLAGVTGGISADGVNASYHDLMKQSGMLTAFYFMGAMFALFAGFMLIADAIRASKSA
jgi:hypothetical protein